MVRQGILCALVALGVVAVWPATAGAAYWEQGGGYYGEPGEANQVTVQFDGEAVTITDTAPIRSSEEAYCTENPGAVGCPPGPPDEFDPPPTCTSLSPNSIRCRYEGMLGSFDLDDADDSLAYMGPGPPLPASGADFPDQLVVSGGAGNDSITGSPYQDRLDGDDDSAQVTPAGDDQLSGGDGDDFLSSGGGDSSAHQNALNGGAGDDRFATEMGTNTVNGGSGDDLLIGGEGDDIARGDEGDDNFAGGNGEDLLLGGADDDELEGGPDKDLINGEAGNDGLEASFHGGCGGPDTLIGGPGSDSVYIFCGEPVLKLRDRTKDVATCKKKVKPVKVTSDKKDKLTGPCA